MRISDRQTARNYLNYLDKAKTSYSETNEKIASGKRFTNISDDVSSATKALRVRVDMSKTEEYYENVKAVNEKLTTTENALTSINDVLRNAHAKVLSAMSGTSGESGRKALANEIEAMRNEILQFANTTYNDAFVLGGSGSGTAPFSTDSSGNFLYNGINVNIISRDSAGYFYMSGADRKEIPMDGDSYVDVGLGITMSGSSVHSGTAIKTSYSGLEILGFGTDVNGNPNNVFNILTNLKSNITTYNAEEVGAYDKKLVSFTSEFRGHLTDVGAKTSFLDTIENRINTTIGTYENQLQRLVGIDDAEEATNQSMNDYVLKAVLKMGSNIIPVSLMDFLN